ncbi:MAG TPA: hypothetical protein VLF59_05745 [Candidatus Saccharimonadales bacterium]|nr:hypothetical protein [Candidatus Saccharimonadales bacterium]
MHLNTRSKFLYWYSALLAVFTCLTILPAPDKATLVKYHLTTLDVRLLSVTLIIPEAIIWFVALFGAESLQRYSRLIKGGAEGKQVHTLARGLFLLAIGMPLASIFSAALNVVTVHRPSFKATAVIIQNYVNLVFPLAAFLFISAGSRGLTDLRKARPRLLMLNMVIGAVTILGIVFCSLITVAHHALRTKYHMSPELVMLTLGIPYVYMWFLGLLACTELQAYTHTVEGIVYRRSWNLLIIGLTAVIMISILLQYLSTLASWLDSLSLDWVLVLLYVLLLIYGAAFIVLALGTKRLAKIEEA